MQFIYQVNINKGSNLNCIEIVILVSNFQLVLNFANHPWRVLSVIVCSLQILKSDNKITV